MFELKSFNYNHDTHFVIINEIKKLHQGTFLVIIFQVFSLCLRSNCGIFFIYEFWIKHGDEGNKMFLSVGVIVGQTYLTACQSSHVGQDILNRGLIELSSRVKFMTQGQASLY